MKALNLNFVVTKLSSARKAKDLHTVFKVHLKSEEGHSLTLQGDSQIREGFPLGEVIQVKIESLKTLDQFKGDLEE